MFTEGVPIKVGGWCCSGGVVVCVGVWFGGLLAVWLAFDKSLMFTEGK